MSVNLQETTTSHVQNTTALSKPAHALPYSDVARELDGHVYDGLSREQAEQRLRAYGPNLLPEQKPTSWTTIMVKQAANTMTIILVLAMAASFYIKAIAEGSVLTAVIGSNIVVGFWMEFSGQKQMQSLKSLGTKTISVVRDGEAKIMETIYVVPGDLVELKVGDCVPADVRLIEAFNLETKEMNMTGESEPVHKDARAVCAEATEACSRRNIAFHSTTVEKGRARGIVFATGKNTEVGKYILDKTGRPFVPGWRGSIVRFLSRAWDLMLKFFGFRAETPLHVKLSILSLALFVVAVVFMMAVVAVNHGSTDKEVLIYAISTGISMIPIALLVVLSITMAKGAHAMKKQNVIVRSLRSIESLGGVTDICSDKTGTLTMGKMTLRTAWVSGHGTYTVEIPNLADDFFNPTKGSVRFSPEEPRNINRDDAEAEGSPITPDERLEGDRALCHFVTAASLANMAQVHPSDEASSHWHARGSPTEVAIQVFACRFSRNRLDLTGGNAPAWKQISEFDFNSDIKKMSVIMEDMESNEQWLFGKGAVERLLETCTRVMEGSGETVDITDDLAANIVANAKAMADCGLRVLALASRTGFPAVGQDEDVEHLDRDEFERELTFHGLVGIYDPPRSTTVEAVRNCHQAQIRVHMLTGDHPDTAQAIAREVGILPSESAMQLIPKDKADLMVVTARQFDALSEQELDALPQLPLVIARCSPLTKSRMIRALQARKGWAAMTGDGVNDVSSLREANVGIAMGISGADVTKDVADIVLADDNFSSIVAAVFEGRRMFDNIQRFVLHVLAQNVGQAMALLIALMWRGDDGYTVFPLSPVEIMCVLLLTSGLPDMALGMQRAESDVPTRPPQSLKWSIFTPELLLGTFVYGLITGLVCLAGYVFVVFALYDGNLGEHCNRRYSPECTGVFKARSTCFMLMTLASLCLALEVMSLRRSFFRMTRKEDRQHTLTQPLRDLWQNKWLCGTIVLAFGVSMMSLYIPGMNRGLFKHAPIGREWGVVAVLMVNWWVFVEGYKWGVRRYYRKQDDKKGDRDDVEARAFRTWMGGQNVEAEVAAVGEKR